MATLQLTVEQVSFENLSLCDLSHDSFSSVVDPNVDFSSMTGKKTANEDKVNSGEISLCKHSPTSTHLSEESRSSLIQKLSENARDGALSEADFLYSYDSLGSAYPTIPLPVAQYLNQQNPDLFAKAKDILNKSDFNSKNASLAADYTTPPSPLKSMASTSEALALQHSVIGKSSIKPVSPEVVAEVVANTRLKLNRHNPLLVSSELSMVQDSYEGISTHDMGPQTSTEKKFFRESENLCKSPDGLYNELIEYPANLISATVEKKSWLSSVNFSNGNNESSGCLIPKSPKHKSLKTSSRRSSNSSVSSKTSTKGSKTPLLEVSVTHSGKKQIIENANVLNCTPSEVCSTFQNTTHEPFYNLEKQETESYFSDNLDVESYSESYDTESNLSEISGVDDEMLHIRKLLTVDIPTSPSRLPNDEVSESLSHVGSSALTSSSTQTANATSDSTTSPVKSNAKNTILLQSDSALNFNKTNQTAENQNAQFFEILRVKSQLEGQVETLKIEMEDIIKDRSKCQSLAVSLQTQMKSHINQIDELTSDKEKIIQALEMAKNEHKQWDNIIAEYQSVIDSKTSEIKALKEDISEAETEKEKLKISLEEMKVDMESKEGAVVGLKKKIAELHVEVQMLLQGKVQLENEVKSIQAEMGTLQKSKVWYQEQLYASQETRNRVHQELITTQAGQVSLNSTLEHLKVENSHLKQQLQDIQHKAMKEKEVLMNHLETIEADMMEREALFKEIQRDKGSAEEIIAERAKKVEEDRSKLTNLSFQVTDLKHQLDATKRDAAERDDLIQDLDKEKAELTKQVALLQKNLNDKDLQYHLLDQDRKEIELKLKHSEITLTAKEEHISVLSNEKICIEVALSAANEEKRVVSEALKNVKENLNRVETSFKHMKAELVSRSSQVEQLLKEKTHLEECLQKAEDQLFHQKNNFCIQTAVNNQNQDLIVDDLNKQKTNLEKIIDVLQKDLQRQHQICAVLQKERDDLNTQMFASQKAMKKIEERVELLQKENYFFQEKNSTIGKEQPQGNFLPLKESIKSDSDRTLDDKILNINSKELVEKQRIYESNIKVLTRKLREKMKECKNLQNELKRFEKNGIKKSKNDKQIMETTTDENVNEQEYKKKVIELQEQLTETRQLLQDQNNLLEQNKNIILDLEKEKGRLAGLSDSQDTIKHRIMELESGIAGKDATIFQLEQEVLDLQQKFHDKETKSKESIGGLELEINREKTLIKELRHQVFQEKRENSQIKRHLSSFKTSLEQANQAADARKQELIVLQSELAIKHQAELKHRAEIEHLQSEVRCKKAEQEKMKKEQEEIIARDPALAEQIKSISWHLKEKNQEVSTLKEQLCLIEERHSLELERKNKQIESLLEELENIKSELTNSRKEKFSYQAKTTELRRALKSSIEKTKQLQSFTSQKSSDEISKATCFDLEIPEPPAPYDDSFINSLLQQSLSLPESRPLSHLQACLSSLKQEMSLLQKQLHEHAEKDMPLLPTS